MRDNWSEENSDGDRKRAVATPILASLSRHDALRFRWAPPRARGRHRPFSSLAMQSKCMTRGNTSTHQISYTECEIQSQSSTTHQGSATTGSKALSSFF